MNEQQINSGIEKEEKVMTNTQRIEAIAAQVDNPKLADVEPGMVYQIWEDGELTLQKCGSLLWCRTLHTIELPIKNAEYLQIKLPHVYNNHSYAYVTREDGVKVREMISAEVNQVEFVEEVKEPEVVNIPEDIRIVYDHDPELCLNMLVFTAWADGKHGSFCLSQLRGAIRELSPDLPLSIIRIKAELMMDKFEQMWVGHEDIFAGEEDNEELKVYRSYYPGLMVRVASGRVRDIY